MLFGPLSLLSLVQIVQLPRQVVTLTERNVPTMKREWMWGDDAQMCVCGGLSY